MSGIKQETAKRKQEQRKKREKERFEESKKQSKCYFMQMPLYEK